MSRLTMGGGGRRILRCVLSASALLATILGWAVPASGSGVSNTSPIAVPGVGTSGPADPYPSEISVDQTGPITDVNVSLIGVSHDFPADLEALLVGPGGENVTLMANASDGTAVSGINLTFDDEATTQLPEDAAMVGGTYQTSDFDGFYGTYPAPPGPFGSTLSVFDGTPADGLWQLFVFDDDEEDAGMIAGGWTLDISTLPTVGVTSFEPARGGAGDTVTVTGSGFTGASEVGFGNTSADAYTVDSDTQITATVPMGARSGPLKVTSSIGTGTSDADFVVQHTRSVSVGLKGTYARGTVRSTDGANSCRSDVLVKVQRLDAGDWRTVSEVRTHANGSFRSAGIIDPGKYRAVATKATLESGDVCLRGTSPIRTK